MASVASQLIEEVTAHAQSDSLEDAGEICADGTYFPNNLRMFVLSCTSNSSSSGHCQIFGLDRVLLIHVSQSHVLSSPQNTFDL